MRIVGRAELLTLRRQWREQGLRVVWTNGCFDLLHPGHIASLQEAKKLGDKLVVGVNSDRSVRVNKGPQRPILNERERATMLAALRFVDAVHIFDEANPAAVLRELQPEVHCKGADYAGKPIPEAAVIEAYGGRVQYLPLIPGISTSELLSRIQRSFARAA